MEDWKYVALCGAVGLNLIVAALHAVMVSHHAWKARRLDRETCATRPLPLNGATAEGCGKGIESARLAEAWEFFRERDQQALAELRARTESLIAQGADLARRAAVGQLRQELQPLLQATLEKARALQGLLPDSPIVQGLLADLRAMSEAIDRTP